MKKGIGVILICIGAACADSECFWIPFALCGIGSVLALTKKKIPSRRQAKEGINSKLLQPDYSTER